MGQRALDSFIPNSMLIHKESAKGVIAVGIFLFFGAVMACLAGTTLIWRGTVLDRMWTMNLLAYRQLAPFGKTVGIPFFFARCRFGSCWHGLVQAPPLGMATGDRHHRNRGLGKHSERLHRGCR